MENHKPISLWSYSYWVSFSQLSPLGFSVRTVASPPNLGESDLDSTYMHLISAHEHGLTLNNPCSDQVLRNHKSTLNSYLAFCNKTLDSRIGREFTVDFVKQSKAYTELVATTNRKTAADKLSILRAWKRTVDKHVRGNMLKSMSGPTVFHKELRLAVAASGQTLREIAKAIKTDLKTLSGWVEGVTPMYKGMPTLRRLEAYLELERGFLESKICYHRKDGNITVARQRDKYSERIRTNLKDSYYVTPAMFSFELKQEWSAFLKYKTCEHPIGLKRGSRARWRVLPIDKGGIHVTKEPLCQPALGLVCASAYRNLLMVEAYLGFLTKAQSDNVATAGLGLPFDEVQTLAMFVIPEFLNAFFEFIKVRSGNLIHNGQANIAGAVSGMTRTKEGYLWQQPELFEKVENFARGRSWYELCEQTFDLCRSWQLAAKGNISRDPKVPLLHLLSMSDPRKPFKDAIIKLDVAAAAASPGSVHQALYKRDALLLALCMFNPLRLRTLTITKYVPPDAVSNYETNLYRTEDGEWWLRFEKGDFKNDGSKKEDYNSPVTKDLSARIENYLEVYRPILVRNRPGSPWVFPNMYGERSSDLGEVIARIARNFIPEVSRLRPHALRHIVATDYLRRNPGQYTFVARLLHDELDTVLKNYAHKQSEAAFRAHEEDMRGFYEGL